MSDLDDNQIGYSTVGILAGSSLHVYEVRWNTELKDDNMDRTQEEQVKRILKMPIISSKDIQGIIMAIRKDIKKEFILSGQTYKNNADADMSDFSIGFYKVIYKKLLGDDWKIINDKGEIVNDDFMGDTMHSFNSLANIILSNASTCVRSPIEKWPKELIEYYDNYHCLASFWVIPMKHGRTNAKLSKYDSLDYYLTRVKNELIKNEEGYFGRFKEHSDFLKYHCLTSFNVRQNPIDIYKKSDKEGCIKELNRINDFWDIRIQELVKNHGDDLYKYFALDLGII